MKSKWVRRILLLGTAYALLVLCFYLFQPFFILQPDRLPLKHEFVFDDRYEEEWLAVDDQIELNVLFFPALKKRKGVVLYFHGNSDNLQRWGHYSSDFTSRGYDVWMYDYRGFGKSPGRRVDKAYYLDARKVFEYVQAKYPGEELVLYGRSLGTSIASELATHVSCDSLILEAPFDNLDHLFKMRYPWLWQPFAVKYDFANDRHLALGIQAPIYIIHGTKDYVVPHYSSLYLKKLLQPNKDRYYLIDGGGHKNLSDFTEYQEVLSIILGNRLS